MTCFVEQKIVRELLIGTGDTGSFYELMELVSKLPSGSRQCRDGIIAAMPQTATSVQWLNDADEILGRTLEANPALRQSVHRPHLPRTRDANATPMR